MVATKRESTASLAERVAARNHALSSAERRVAQWLGDNPEEVAFASAGVLGELTGTSDATVIRTVKSLGYAGLPELKRTLQGDIRNRLTPAARFENSLAAMGNEPESVLARVLGESQRLLDQSQHTIAPKSFAKAVTLVAGAHEVVVSGLGHLGVLADYLALRLVRVGLAARSARHSGYLLADDLLRLARNDVVVLIARGSVFAETDAVLRRAAEVGAKVVLITDTLGPALADRVATSLSTPPTQGEMSAMQSTTLAILDALAMAVAAQDGPATLARMEEMQHLREELRPASRPNRPRRSGRG